MFTNVPFLVNFKAMIFPLYPFTVSLSTLLSTRITDSAGVCGTDGAYLAGITDDLILESRLLPLWAFRRKASPDHFTIVTGLAVAKIYFIRRSHLRALTAGQ